MNRVALPFIFLSTFFVLSVADFRDTKIDENKNFVFMDMFQFGESGGIQLNVSHIEISPNTTNLNLSKAGFFITPRDSFLDFSNGTVCSFDSNSSVGSSMTTLFTFDKLPTSNGRNSLQVVFNVTYPGEFLLLYQNCVPQLQLSMDVQSAMYNIIGSGHRSYLSANRTYQIWFDPVLISIYLALSVIWFVNLFQKRLKLSGVFDSMLLALLSKLICLVLQLVNICYLYKSGDTQSWTVFFLALTPRLSPEIPFLLMAVFIYSGWRNKLFVKTIVSLQIFFIIIKILIFSNGPCGIDWSTNLFVSRFLDSVIIALVRYFTREWAIRHLKLGGKVHGKAAMNLKKKEKVQSLTFSLYIYNVLTLYVAISCETGMCPLLVQYVWQSAAIHEVAEVALFLFMMCKLWHEVRCNVIVFTDDEEKAAAETLSNVEQCCCCLEAEASTDETPYDPFAPLMWCGTRLGLIHSP